MARPTAGQAIEIEGKSPNRVYRAPRSGNKTGSERGSAAAERRPTADSFHIANSFLQQTCT